jgi:hypothetical protein
MPPAASLESRLAPAIPQSKIRETEAGSPRGRARFGELLNPPGMNRRLRASA